MTSTAGRRTTIINAIVEQGYNDLEIILTHLIDKMSLTPQQIIARWHKSKLSHFYFAIYPFKTSSGVTPTTCGQSYSKSEEESGEAWQEILELHGLLETVTHRMQ